MIRIRAFRATHDRKSCELFAVGHERVLRDFGVEKVTSANHSWMENPNVFVFLVESSDGKKVYGGSRIHIVGNDIPLPIEEAIGEMDSGLYDLIAKDEPGTVGEMCALWNANEIRGSGVSIILTKANVAKAGVKIANLLKINTLWVLCAPYTVGMVREAGFEIVEELGDNGTFPYPKPDLPATVLTLEDTDVLSKATESNRKDIFDLRHVPIQKKIEHGPAGEIIIEYNLYIEDL